VPDARQVISAIGGVTPDPAPIERRKCGGGPAAFSQTDRQAFGAALDRFLAKAVKKPQG